MGSAKKVHSITNPLKQTQPNQSEDTQTTVVAFPATPTRSQDSIEDLSLEANEVWEEIQSLRLNLEQLRATRKKLISEIILINRYYRIFVKMDGIRKRMMATKDLFVLSIRKEIVFLHQSMKLATSQFHDLMQKNWSKLFSDQSLFDETILATSTGSDLQAKIRIDEDIVLQKAS